MSRCAAAFVACLLGCLLSAMRRPPSKLRKRPPSIVCYADRVCNATPATFQYPDTAEGAMVYGVHGPDLSDAEQARMMRTLGSRFAAASRSGRTPVSIHVGPNILLPSEVELYGRLFGTCPLCRLAFVEPQPSVLVRLQLQVEELSGFGLRSSHLEFLNAAVCVNSTASLTMYRLDVRICRDFPHRRSCPFAANRSLMRTSIDEEYVVREVFKFGAREGLPNLTKNELRKYIKGFPVPCFTAAELLRKLKVPPSDVDFITVDAEGHDEDIVEMLLPLEGFRPAVLKFEWSYGSRGPRLARIVNGLARRGYNVHKSQQDLVAVQAHG